MSSKQVQLHVIIAGGGICGLSCAIGLRRAGHRVTVYERYPATADSGHGIVVRPHGIRILRSWGLDLASVGAQRYREGNVIDGKTLNVVFTAFSEPQTEENSQMNTTRSDLCLLLRRAIDREGEGQGSIEVVYGKEVVDYDADRPAVQFADGSWEQADLVLACDGVKSRAVHRIAGKESPAVPTGYSAFRLTLPSADLKDIPTEFGNNETVKAIFEKDSGVAWFVVTPDREFIWWICHFNEMHAFNMVIPDNDAYASSKEWTATCDQNVLLTELSGWHPIFNKLLASASAPLLYKIVDRDPIEVVHKGGLVMLGDALHPMRPYMGSGGSQAIEDAGVLEVCLTGLTDKSQLPGRLEVLRRLRVPRYASIQMGSSVRSGEANPAQRYKEVFDNCRKWFAAQDQTHLESRAAFGAWIDAYDALEEAKTAINELVG